MASAVFKLSAILMLVAVFAVDVSAEVTDRCLACIAEAVSGNGARHSTFCVGEECGLFSITWTYWAEGGKPTLNGQAADANDAYPNCTNDPYCAARTVKGYMEKYGKDCNNDGRIDCYDYMAIHQSGVVGCTEGVPYNYAQAFKQCASDVGL